MAVVSKELFYKLVDKQCCCEVIHPHIKGCVNSFKLVAFCALPGTFKFFLPIYALDILMNYKKINKEYLKKQLYFFLYSWLYGYNLTTITFGCTCLFRNMLGKFYYLTSAFLPGLIGGFSLLWEEKLRQLNTLLFATLCFESFYNYLRGEEIIPNSLIFDTKYFMATNAIFMYLYKTNTLAKKSVFLWFFDPRPKKKNENTISSLNCCKKSKCYKHILKDSSNKFLTGYVLYIVKSILPKTGKMIQKPWSIFSALLSKNAIASGMFFGLYVFIYKVMNKILLEAEGQEKPYHTLIAGFLAGITYCIKPNMQFHLLPTMLTLQLLWIYFREKFNIPKWYFTELLFAFCFGTLFHTRFLLPTYCPEYCKKMFNLALNNDSRARVFFSHIPNYIEKKIKETGIPITKKMYMSVA